MDEHRTARTAASYDEGGDDRRALREDVSRWVDGDIAPHEVDRAVRVLASPEGRAIWAELHLVGDGIRGLDIAGASCAGRIAAAIEREPAIVAPAARRERLARENAPAARARLLGRGGRAWAAVASMAAVGLVSTAAWQGWRGAPNGNAALAGGTVTAVSTGGAITSSPVQHSDWAAYLRAHQESADSTSVYPVRQYLRPAVNAISE